MGYMSHCLKLLISPLISPIVVPTNNYNPPIDPPLRSLDYGSYGDLIVIYPRTLCELSGLKAAV